MREAREIEEGIKEIRERRGRKFYSRRDETKGEKLYRRAKSWIKLSVLRRKSGRGTEEQSKFERAIFSGFVWTQRLVVSLFAIPSFAENDVWTGGTEF